MYDIIIVGRGPAGLSCALYLGRAGYNVLVIGGPSTMQKVTEMDNYLGIKTISGPEFMKIAEDQVKNVGVELEDEKLLKFVKEENNEFKVITNKNEYTAKAVVISIGSNKTILRIKDLETFIGRGVSYCVSCDGFFYKNKNVGIIGNSEYAIHEALELKNYTSSITIYTNGKELVASEKYLEYSKQFSIDTRKIESLTGENKLENINFENKESIEIDGVFVANETPNITDFASTMGMAIKSGKIVIDDTNMTNIEGVFACGDVVNGFMQVSTAVGSGADASRACIRYLINQKLKKLK
ncbi:Glucosaminate ammonia-lyase [compost metagenome]